VAFVPENVDAANARAVAAGAVEVKGQTLKPWGQNVAYVRCPDGNLVELCSPVRSEQAFSSLGHDLAGRSQWTRDYHPSRFVSDVWDVSCSVSGISFLSRWRVF